jgi:hypothetical protein
MKKLVAAFALLLTLTVAQAQDKQEIKSSDYQNTRVEMADKMREDGKIYVLVAIVTTILGGLLVYAVSIDRKLSKLEKEMHQ